jgi:DNA adenine methylase
LQSFFRYPGGKHKLRSTILPMLQDERFLTCEEYREPFCGGGGIGLEMMAAGHRVWINDRDIGIWALWHSVKHYSDELVARIMAYTPSIEDFAPFKQYLLADTKPQCKDEIVETAFRKLVIHQISFSGLGVMSGGPLGGRGQQKCLISSRWSPKSICKKIRHIRTILGAVKLSNSDYSSLICDESRHVLLYLDPPYFEKGDSLYQHGFKLEDHVRLRDLLRATPHHWILSYDNVGPIRDLYRWAEVIEIPAQYSIAGSITKSELLVCPRSYKPLRLVAAKPKLILPPRATPAESPGWEQPVGGDYGGIGTKR